MQSVVRYGIEPTIDSSLSKALGPAQLCALAWARSNFPPEGGDDILEASREGNKVTVLLAQERVEFHFATELDAHRALKELPPVMECQNPFALAANVDLEALSRAMNFGCSVDQANMAPAIPGFHIP